MLATRVVPAAVFRITPRGRLYNVYGRQAVERMLQSGTRDRLGTDEPDALVAALQPSPSTNMR